MGVKAYQVSRPIDPLRGSQGLAVFQVIVRASSPAMAAAIGAADMGCDPKLVKVQAFETRGSVPGGSEAKYRAAMERYEKGEAIVDESDPAGV